MWLIFLLSTICQADQESAFERWMLASYDVVGPTAPGLTSIVDSDHIAMRGFGPYTQSNVAAFDVATNVWLAQNWNVSTQGCLPGVPFPGACGLVRNGAVIGAFVPYKSSQFIAVRDTYHNNIKDDGKWVVRIFGNIVVLQAGVTLPTAQGNQTAKANDAILYLEENWVRLDKYPYAGNARYVYKVRSRFYTTFPINSQGFQNQLAMFDVYDASDESMRCDGVLSSITNYVNGTSGPIRSQHRLIHTCPKA